MASKHLGADCITRMPKEMVEILYDTAMLATQSDYLEKFDTVHGTVIWAWEEDEEFILKHKSKSIVAGTNFVKYPRRLSGLLEARFQDWVGAGQQDENDRVCFELTKPKFRMARTGLKYSVSFTGMMQVNRKSQNERNVRRQVHFLESSSSRLIQPDLRLPSPMCWSSRSSRSVDISASLDADFLPTCRGQLLEVIKKSADGHWLYGTVVFDPRLANEVKIESCRPSSGWFPAVLCRQEPELADALRSMSSNSEYRKIPRTWKVDKEGCVQVPKGSSEWHTVSEYFKDSLEEEINYLNIKRVQSSSLWKIYAIQREEVMRQFAEYPKNLENNVCWPEEKWLFHGTTAEAVPHIVKRGFNRSFAGRNGACFGKGSYFARDASYSTAYAAPDKKQIQHIFICRMVVGDWSEGSNNQLTPGTKPDGGLYDSTVDNVTNPTIFVAYHDAQVYPEYLVSFQLKA